MFSSLDKVKIDSIWLSHVHRGLSTWFSENRRSFPWRETKDPYAILVAEKLLQQTSARPHVVEIYSHFIADYPDLLSLANAEIADVLEIIRSLGLPSRATELVEISRCVLKQHDGIVPRSIGELLDLPGIGHYVARAILCFAYGEPIAIVDTNVARWIYRLFGIEDRLPANPARKRQLLELAQLMLNRETPKEYNWAILDLCAVACTSHNPTCHQCPLVQFCIFGKQYT